MPSICLTSDRSSKFDFDWLYECEYKLQIEIFSSFYSAGEFENHSYRYGSLLPEKQSCYIDNWHDKLLHPRKRGASGFIQYRFRILCQRAVHSLDHSAQFWYLCWCFRELYAHLLQLTAHWKKPHALSVWILYTVVSIFLWVQLIDQHIFRTTSSPSINSCTLKYPWIMVVNVRRYLFLQSSPRKSEILYKHMVIVKFYDHAANLTARRPDCLQATYEKCTKQ